MYRFSIIVPCYNIAGNIEALFKMLSPKDFLDYEVIFVDDCSKDNSFDVMKKYVGNYPNYRVLQTEKNGGPGLARNFGLNAASGEYILFCDSDDEFDISCLSVVDSFLTEHPDADMLVFPHEQVRGGKRTRNDTYNAYIDQSLVHRNDVATGCLTPFAKVLKLDLIREKNVYFPGRMTGEDICFVTEYAIYAKSIYKLDIIYYRYIMNPGSITHQYKMPLEIKTTFDILQPIYREHFPEIETIMFANGHLLTRAKQMCSASMSLRQISQWFKKENQRYPGWIKEIDLKKESLYRRSIYQAMYHSNGILIKLIMLVRDYLY